MMAHLHPSRRLATALASLTLTCACAEGDARNTWHVARGALVAPDGRAAILRGLNLSGAQKSAPYLDHKTPADYQRVRTAWGMNGLRFVMTWAAVEPEAGRFDDAYLDRAAERLAWAEAAGLWVVLDMHQDVYGEGFGFDGAPRWTCDEARYAAFVPTDPWFFGTLDPNVVACFDDLYGRADLRAHFRAAWRHVAERLGSARAVIGFDVLNEPSWGSWVVEDFEHQRLAPLYDEVVRAVREAAPHWVAFLEPSASRNLGFPTSLRRFDLPDVMYAPHSYDAAAESGEGFDPAQRGVILDKVAKLAEEARALDAGLWIGEYGGMADRPGIVEYMTAQYDAAGRAAASTMYWAYDESDGYGVLTPRGEEKTVLLDVLVRPYPERVAGTPLAYAFDAATRTFTLDYQPDPAVTLPTTIIVPQRAYPSGYQVACDGCTWSASGDVVSVETPPTGPTARVTVHP